MRQVPVRTPYPRPLDAPIDTQIPEEQPTPTPPPAPVATPTPHPVKRVLYGTPEPGRPGYVRSPYTPEGGLIDCRGLAPGSEVKDPYTPGKTMLVP